MGLWNARPSSCHNRSAMETEAQRKVREAFDAFDLWCQEFRENNPNCEMSILELAQLYAKYGKDS